MKIKVNKLNFSYGDKNILKNIDVEFEEGNFYGILGQNGSGKTTFLKIILGLLKVKNSIYIDEKKQEEYSSKNIARLISFIPQDYNQDLNISVTDMILLGRNPYLNLFEKPKLVDYELVKEILRKFDLEGYALKNFNELSGGEKQLIILARAFIQESKFIVLDESISNLDIKNQHKIMEILLEFVINHKKTVIMSLHIPELAKKYCTHLLMIKDGSVFKFGDKDEVYKNEYLTELYDFKFV